MGAAWRSPNDRQVDEVAEAVHAVADLGMETCVTLGMLTESQAQTLADADSTTTTTILDTSPDFYGEIITTRTYQDRLDTLAPAERSVSASARAGSSAWARRDGNELGCCSNWRS